MKKSIIFLLIIFVSSLLAGELQYPKIVDMEYDVGYRKGKTEFADFLYLVEVQGVYKEYKMLLEITLYNKKDERIKTFRKIVIISKNKLQLFRGSKMILLSLAVAIENDIVSVGVKLKLLEKKY